MPFENPARTKFTGKYSLKKALAILSLLVGGAALAPLSDAAGAPGNVRSVKLGWNAVPESGIAAYHVHVGSSSGEYTQVLETGLDMSVTIGSLEYGKTYYFAVKAVDSKGVEGPLSSELAIEISLPPLPLSVGMTAASGATALEWSYPRSALASSPEFIIQQSSDLVNWTEAGTVTADKATGSDPAMAKFSWAIQSTQGKMFYRMGSRNWLGDGVAE